MTFQTHLFKKIIATPLGDMLLAASSQGLAGTWFVQGQKHNPTDTQIAAWSFASKGDASQAILDKASQQLLAYFSGQLKAFDLPFDLSSGTVFQQRVWREIIKIEAGKTTTYGSICQAIGKPQAARAVGAATGRNPIGIIIPCHRVVGSTGAMTGYAGGLERKVHLLELEGVLTNTRAKGQQANGQQSIF
jgi:methylated-DNA-[protein]-cysteine S-methyltransferase